MALVVGLALSVLPEQNKSAVDQWIQRHYEAVELYRRGDTHQALALLGTMTADEQKKAIEAIGAQLARIAAGWTPKKEDVVPWPNNAVRALGALHFEAALVAVKGTARDDQETAEHHMQLGGVVLDLLLSVVKAADPTALRWILAIALERMAHANFADAYRVLQPYCEDTNADAALLVACGTLDEGFASLPAEQLMRMQPPTQDIHTLLGQRPTLSFAVRNLSYARYLRARWLESAQKRFERALEREPLDPEAQLRLAQVRMQQQEHDRSATLLENLSVRTGLDARTQYLAHLFLGRVRLLQTQLDAAAAALNRLTPHQSGLLAKAQLAQRRGDAREAAALADRASRLQTDDPWWSYRFGQYWLPDQLLAQLRAEARK